MATRGKLPWQLKSFAWGARVSCWCVLYRECHRLWGKRYCERRMLQAKTRDCVDAYEVVVRACVDSLYYLLAFQTLPRASLWHCSPAANLTRVSYHPVCQTNADATWRIGLSHYMSKPSAAEFSVSMSSACVFRCSQHCMLSTTFVLCCNYICNGYSSGSYSDEKP